MKRFIRKVAVLGSGVMGSRIACHYANIGCEVILLDMPPKELNDLEKKKGASLEDKEFAIELLILHFSLHSNQIHLPYTVKHLPKESRRETLMMIFIKLKIVIG